VLAAIQHRRLQIRGSGNTSGGKRVYPPINFLQAARWRRVVIHASACAWVAATMLGSWKSLATAWLDSFEDLSLSTADIAQTVDTQTPAASQSLLLPLRLFWTYDT
jgi:hypothetical protein